MAVKKLDLLLFSIAFILLAGMLLSVPHKQSVPSVSGRMISETFIGNHIYLIYMDYPETYTLIFFTNGTYVGLLAQNLS
jgi:hypothetical protein